MVWSNNIAADNVRFLTQIDAELYHRTAHSLVGLLPDTGSKLLGDHDRARKDVSALARLVWHHGIETFVMLLGALLQAPRAVEGYFLKCRTDDARLLASGLLADKVPSYWRTNTTEPFSLGALVKAVHVHAGWQVDEGEKAINRFTLLTRKLLASYTNDQEQLEYNALKHGLRASQGSFILRVGPEEAYGIPAPEASMQTIGYSKDASSFGVASALPDAERMKSRVHFTIQTLSVPWSLEAVITELQILSILVGNTLSALQIINDVSPSTVKFTKTIEDSEFWESYENILSPGIISSSFGPSFDIDRSKMPTEDQIKATYNRQRPGSSGLY